MAEPVERTTKWKNTSAIESDPPTPIRPTAREPQSVPVPEPSEAPPYEDYLPFGADGKDKQDGKKRVMILLDGEGTRLMPVRWFNMSKLEVTILMAEVNRIMALEMAGAYLEREKELASEIDRQVMAALRRAGLLSAEERPQAPMEKSVFEEGE